MVRNFDFTKRAVFIILVISNFIQVDLFKKCLVTKVKYFTKMVYSLISLIKIMFVLGNFSPSIRNMAITIISKTTIQVQGNFETNSYFAFLLFLLLLIF